MSQDAQFSTREVPWMKVGTTIDVHGVTAEEAITLGGLNFEVETRPAGYLDSRGEWRTVSGRVALVRADTDEVFNYATEDYHPVQYREAFEFFDNINPTYVAAGTLRNGRQGFLVAELPERSELNMKLRGVDDPHKLYVILRTSQDLSRGIEIIVSTLRARCMNQLTLPSLKRDVPQMWSIRHTRNVRARMEQARDVLATADAYVDAFTSITQRLADIDVDFDEARRLLTRVLPNKPKREEQLDSIIASFSSSPTVGERFFGTGWGLTNAVDEYFEWLRPARGRTDESRFTDGLDGSAHTYTARIAQLLLAR